VFAAALIRLRPPHLTNVGVVLPLLETVHQLANAHYRASVPGVARGKKPAEQAVFWASYINTSLAGGDVSVAYALERLVENLRVRGGGAHPTNAWLQLIRARAPPPS
jgi:hypothetical protein